MQYPYKYPEIYAELARQGKHKSELSRALGITMAGLRYKQSVGDFTGTEMLTTSKLLGKSATELFELKENNV